MHISDWSSDVCSSDLEKVRDYVSRDLFADIMESEEHHVDELEKQFDLIESMGLQHYIQLQARTVGDDRLDECRVESECESYVLVWVGAISLKITQEYMLNVALVSLDHSDMELT